MPGTKVDHPAKAMSAYAYQVVPSQSGPGLDTIRTLLDEEQANARRMARIWVGRIVIEPRLTNILAVSDNPAQDLEIHGRLADVLQELNVVYSICMPLAVVDTAQDRSSSAL